MIRKPNYSQYNGGTQVLQGQRNSRPKDQQEKSWPRFFGEKGGVLMTISRRVKQLMHNTTPAYCRSQRRFWKKLRGELCKRILFYAGQCTCSQGGNDHACFGELGILLH
ncbi:unnamed protein product [Ixodes pacificus]